MSRFYIPADDCRSGRLALTGSQAHHAATVLRARPGEEVAVLDGAGTEFSCRVESVSPRQVLLEVEGRKSEPPPPWRVTLVQAIPKGKLFDAILEKATELGVWRIVPLLSQRVTTHLEGEAGEHKAEKWRQTTVEAIKQCGQRWLPQVERPVTLPELLARSEAFDMSFVASLQDDSRHLRSYLSAGAPIPKTLRVWIGPEGDFAPEEMTAIKGAGALPISLGPLVLRVETAAICTLAILNHELRALSEASKP
jgi:16S rRNA (uracil1498-N3)-methyltransferase